MRRFLSLTVTAAAIGVLATAGAQSALASPVPAARGCSGATQVTIRSLTFSPATAAPGQTVQATVVARNCTRAPLQATLQWSARFVDATAGVPAGCPVIDPIAFPASFPARGRFSSSIGYLVFPSCTATALRVTARFTGAAGVLAERTADVPIVAAG
jgi:hypothetical protein